ncbi:MAG: FAD-binding protein, partial [Candidatus Firestonebacteria bacterium]|nr:FAD-binding protein [Candidatus Firestonebacteria bacterium]
MADEKFDAIVVGAGPSGLAAAITLAKAGLEVALLERGSYPGSKNVMGGIFYRHPLETILPEFWKTAPVERPIVEQRFWMLGDNGHVGGGVRSEKFDGDKPNCWTVLRAKFDRWLSEQAEAAGVMLLAETKVESLLQKDGKVIGVHTLLDDGDLYADVVVIAEGVNSILLRDMGIHPEIKTNQVATAVKEIISLPSEKIEDRFNVEKGQGVSIELLGSASQGGMGLGFLYTNRDSISLGIGVLVSDLARLKLKPNDLLEGLKNHPSVRPLIAGGKTEEYLAHFIPEGATLEQLPLHALVGPYLWLDLDQLTPSSLTELKTGYQGETILFLTSSAAVEISDEVFKALLELPCLVWVIVHGIEILGHELFS